jgi:hypothetical protein
MKPEIILYIIISITVLAFSVNAQVTRIVLFEEGTNASCSPCAANNPILKAFLDAHPAEATAIKYHASWPGYDPMYQANPTQNTERIVNYYNMNSTGVPYCNADGVIQDIWPFTITNFTNALNTRLAILTPITINVNDIRIAGDSVKSTITLNLLTNLPSGDYRLRVMALERFIIYTSPPGTNGETQFEHVFRRAYPNTTGTAIQTTAGTYQFVFTYKRESTWQDTSVYTIAFVQNDVNKEVINAAKGSYSPLGVIGKNEIPSDYSLSQNYPNPFNPSTNIKFSLPKDGLVSLKVYNMVGAEIKTLVEGNHKAGEYNIYFDGSELSSGVYFYTLRANEFNEAKKMILIK